jgi:tRNA(Ile)-lysidine synthase
MLLHRVKRTIDHYHLLNQGDRLVVGVSAGVDSMVLLHLLNACRDVFDLSLIVAHVNHGIRPKEPEKEADLVQKECERSLPSNPEHSMQRSSRGWEVFSARGGPRLGSIF